MCGIVAVLGGSTSGPALDGRALLEEIGSVLELLPSGLDASGLAGSISQAAELCEDANRKLEGVSGILVLARDPSLRDELVAAMSRIQDWLSATEKSLDSAGVDAPRELEEINAALLRLADAAWSIRRDRVRTAVRVAELAGPDASDRALAAYTSIQIALSAIDRLEVRGRDSAGIHVLVVDHGLGDETPEISDRTSDALFRSLAVRRPHHHLSFVYKAAAEIGELGDNTAAIRAQIAGDELLRRALAAPDARATVLGHTRWASVGIISEANAHPLNQEEEGRTEGPYVVAALNGDVDNYADLKVAGGLCIPDEITTDAKVIPVLVSRRLADGDDLTESFRRTVASFDGSVAIAASSAADPSKLLLALRGSGQALYVGFGPDTFVVASEPYGLVEQCRSYLRMDGEAQADGADASARGQVVVLDAQRAGTLEGVERIAYDGTPLPVDAHELKTPEITTRDVDRGDFPHYLLKEISESPRSFRKTLRGRLVERDGVLDVVLGPDALPPELIDALSTGAVRRILVIGQGTAAVAGQAVAAAIRRALGALPMTVQALPATELSGFELHDDMTDTLLVAISQSGTTTDTNRTVDVARARGARVVSIVNRRNSDLASRSEGVLYTSDGRDVEMAVPSTKAFYAQVAAGFLLAEALATHAGAGSRNDRAQLLEALRDLPSAMERVLASRAEIAEIAHRHAPSRRYWAVVGNGTNRVAAEEVRIKLSELCYKSIASDFTEDKKHIDLSAEPMIVVCAAGLSASNASDVAKEIAIYRAHKAAPIVIADEGARYPAALDLISVPAVHPDVAFVLSAMAGHLFGYEAALAIDAQARMLRQARAAIEETTREVRSDRWLRMLRPRLEPASARFYEALRTGSLNGHLEASTAVRLASLFRYGTGITPLELYQVEHGKIGTPAVVVEDLTDALTAGIDELTRPIDAIKHQAKTVTVGISRADETFLQVALVREALAAGTARDRLSYRTLRTLAALDPAVVSVTGYTHYLVDGDPSTGEATIQVTDRSGIARDIPSRTDRDPRLRGTKARVAAEREVLVTRGRRDGRIIVLVPEVKGVEVTGLVLLHVDLRDRLPAPAMRSVLEGYRDRYAALRDLVTETEPVFRDDLLADIDVSDLLIASVQHLAERWRS